MQIEVLFFAGARDAVGTPSLRLELPDGDRVTDAFDRLAERHPQLRPLAGSLRFAVNEAFVDRSHALGIGDTLALLPPVSGG